jgi:hypothetical protein
MTRLFDPNFVYVPAVATDVAATFRRHGFKPRAERVQVLAEEEVPLGVESAWPGLIGEQSLEG